MACYLKNRSPVATLDVTPADLWFGKQPDLSRLKIFGSVAYSIVLGKVKKLDERTKKLIFVGYTHHGYRLWNEELNKIEIARDVIISENTLS